MPSCFRSTPRPGWGFGGTSGAPTTTNRDITLPVVCQFMGTALLMFSVWLAWEMAHPPGAAEPVPIRQAEHRPSHGQRPAA